jgi:hypothetical protein
MTFFSCQDKTNSTLEKIDIMLERLSKDKQSMEAIEKTDFQVLVSSHQFCDSVLRHIETNKKEEFFQTLDIAKGYLQQFDIIWPEMQQNISYSQSQLTNLKSDIEDHILNDSISKVYLEEEAKAATLIHNQVLYFEDRFNSEIKKLKSLKCELKKTIK